MQSKCKNKKIRNRRPSFQMNAYLWTHKLIALDTYDKPLDFINLVRKKGSLCKTKEINNEVN